MRGALPPGSDYKAYTCKPSFRYPEVRAKRASKGSSGASACILRGPLRGHLRMTSVAQAPSSSRRPFAPELCQPRHVKREVWPARESLRGGAPVSQCVTPSSPFPIPKPIQRPIKIRKWNADKRWSYPPHLTGAAPPPAGDGSPVGVPPRLSPKRLVIPKAQLQARLPGTRSDAGSEPTIMRWRHCQRALPAVACPSPGKHPPPRS